jgi:glycosyltransferase involved in cell wall biosynthesis
MTFSILIPSWNNLSYLKLCIESIEKNSSFVHQILVHLNEAKEAETHYLSQKGIEFTTSEENIGICKALNTIAKNASSDYIMYMNDDMYCLPQWDKHIADEIHHCNTTSFMFSATMIEPKHTNNKAVIVANFGDTVDTFQEEQLLQTFNSYDHHDWSGSSWPPNIVHRTMWEKLNGYNEYFSPGMSSDDDFCMRMWLVGCRLFKGISASRVYHFQCKSTGRIVKNDGRKQFLTLYGMTQNMFNTFYLKKGEPFTGLLDAPSQFNLAFLAKKILLKIRGH